MWANAATCANVALLHARGIRVVGPAAGEQACGEVGVRPDAGAARDQRPRRDADRANPAL